MVSKTSQTRTIRKNKQVKIGRKRKNKLANLGSTKSQKELFENVPVKTAEDSSN